jgi:predicted nucleotidyltransferase
LQLASFELALENKLKIPVDVVMADSLFDDVRTNIEREELVVYEVQ